MYPQTRQVTIRSSFGKPISFGKGIFINQSITFVDLGGIYLEDNVLIEANVTVLAGITIGKKAVVAADATVTKDVPDNVMVAGTPANMPVFSSPYNNK